MPTTSTPIWSAPHNGLIGDASATAGTGQVNQFLGTHGIQAIYEGGSIGGGTGAFVTPSGPWLADLQQLDIDQPFTVPGTTVGRVQVPVLPVGNGADLLVSLCADNGSGLPGTMICQTRVPASWICQLSPIIGTATGSPGNPLVSYSGNALALAQFQGFIPGQRTVTSYPTPARTGIAAASSTTWYGGYVMQIGGVNNDTALASVYTIPYNTADALSPSIPQPDFPTANDGSSASCVAIDAVSGGPVVVNSGGGTSYEGAPVSTVYTATLTTTSGALSAWSAQASLPYAVQGHMMVASDSYVYSIGGKNGGGAIASVSYAQVQNAQITSWNAAIPLPQAAQLTLCGVSNGFLFVCGGTTPSLTPIYSSVWYAEINDDGSLGPWQTGPSMPTGDFNLNCNPFTNEFGLICAGDNAISILPVTASGPAPYWYQRTGGNIGLYPGWYDTGSGTIISTAQANGNAYTYRYSQTPSISVPLPASGLTSGNTYHVLMQQQGGDLNDCLILAMTRGPVDSGLSSLPGAYSWSTWPSYAGNKVGSPVLIYDQTPPQTILPSLPLHLWDDQGGKITTLLTATTPDGRLLGICEATKRAYALNQNTGFESGIAPWTCTGGTVTQSSTEVYTGQYAAQVVPSGTAASVILASEIMPCMPGQWCTATGWLWLTNAVTSNVSMSIAWCTAVSGGTSISTSASLVSVSAATWTQETQSLQAPAGAYGWQLQATLSGTPASSQVFYVDAIHGHYTYTGPQNATVTEILWSGTGWPEYGLPTGTTQLA